MPDTSNTIESLLLTQGQQLQALARGLLADEHAAEDVLQETWLRSVGDTLMGRAPLQSVSGWLKSVVTNLALDRKRAGRTRTHHEQRASRAEATTATDQAVAEREIWQRVIDAVSQLDEPYKSVIFMRYFQNVPPRQIASQRGLPLATVKSQLNRALGKLRACLDELSEGNRQSWAQVLVGSLGGMRAGWGGFAALSLVVGCLVLMACSLLWDSVQQSSSSESPISALVLPASAREPNSDADPGAQTPKALPSARSSAAQQESGAAASPGSTPAASERLSFALNIEVVDELDAPVWKAEVLLAPAGHPTNSVGRTGPRGKLELRWPALEATGKFTVAIRRRSELRSGLQVIELRAGEAFDLRLGLHDNFLRNPHLPLPSEPEGSGFGKPHAGGASLAPTAALSAESQGEIKFCWSESHDTWLARAELEQDLRSRTRFSRAIEAPPGQTPLHQDSARSWFHYKGTVLGSDGQAADGALMLARGENKSGMTFGTGPNGRFDYGQGRHSETWLRAGGGHFGQASTHVPLDPKDESDHFEWNPTLDRGLEAKGSILVDGQRSPGAWYVDAELAGARSNYTDTNQFLTGQFEIPNLPEGAGRLTLMTASSWPFAVRVQAARFPSDANQFSLSAADLRAVPVNVLVLDPAGEPCQAQVQLWQVSSGRGVWLDFDQETGWHSRAAVPPGTYRVQVGDEQHGYTQHGVYLAQGPGALLIGPLQLKSPGQIQLRVNGELPALDEQWTWQLERVSDGVASTLTIDSSLASGALEVPEGRYRLALSGPEFNGPTMELDVPAGGVAEANVTLEL